MKFCPHCENILLPRKGKLYCQACEEEFDLGNNEEDYKIVKTIKHDDKEITPIIVKSGFRGEKISEQDRKAYEEYFSKTEQEGY